jgi:ketosteroid isomerase-like protein
VPSSGAKELAREVKDFIKSEERPVDAPQTNADIVRSLIDAWNRRDPGVHAYHDDAEWDFTRSRFGEIRHSWKGVDGMREVFGKVLSAWTELRVEPERIVEVDDDVLVVARHFGRRPTSGIEISDGGAYVIGMRDGKVSKFTFYPDPDEAFAAVGLPRDQQARG